MASTRANRFTKGLNAEQRKAVMTTEGPLLVLAGAGTGKTRVITHRIANMLHQGVSPKSILAMTFTNRAAGEMKERINKLVGGVPAADLTVGTFHSFAVRSLRQYGERVGVRKRFAICDASDQVVAVKQAMRELRIPETRMQPRACLSRISLLKSSLQGPEHLISSDNEWDADIGRVYQRYDESLRACGLLDFDDLLIYMVKLLSDSKTRASFRKRFQYLFVDEYQDTNGPQYEIVKHIGGKHRNVCVVGDDDQSIYGWRGADVSKILNFEKDFPEATVVTLEINYRSTVEILKGANSVIRNNTSRHEKSLKSAIGTGEAIRVSVVEDEEHEAIFVVDDILRRVQRNDGELGDFAILFRTQVQPRLFEMQLRQNHVPYTLIGGMSFFDRKEVRDVLAYLRLVDNPSDELSLLRVINTPPRGIGSTTVKKALVIAAEQQLSLADVLAQASSFSELPAAGAASATTFVGKLKQLQPLSSGAQLVELVKRTISAANYADEIKRCYKDAATRASRWEAIGEIVNMAELHARQKTKATLGSFLENLALAAVEDDDEEDDAKDRVMLMTMHSSKGLEFEQVYLVGAEEGLLPHTRSVQDGDVAEERRLAYVGITRAKRRLTLTLTRSRARYGERIPTMASRFIYEMRGKEPPLDKINAHHQRTAASASASKTTPSKKKAKKKTRAMRKKK
jgi:DNA helicase-2/ATP-dependent DNA helicase PcrA